MDIGIKFAMLQMAWRLFGFPVGCCGAAQHGTARRPKRVGRKRRARFSFGLTRDEVKLGREFELSKVSVRLIDSQ